MDKIVITGIRAHGFHGVLPQEKVVGQDFIVDCELFLNLTQAINKDDLSKSVDYAEISLLIKEKIEKDIKNYLSINNHSEDYYYYDNRSRSMNKSGKSIHLTDNINSESVFRVNKTDHGKNMYGEKIYLLTFKISHCEIL